MRSYTVVAVLLTGCTIGSPSAPRMDASPADVDSAPVDEAHAADLTVTAVDLASPSLLPDLTVRADLAALDLTVAPMPDLAQPDLPVGGDLAQPDLRPAPMPDLASPADMTPAYAACYGQYCTQQGPDPKPPCNVPQVACAAQSAGGGVVFVAGGTIGAFCNSAGQCADGSTAGCVNHACCWLKTQFCTSSSQCCSGLCVKDSNGNAGCQ